MQERTIKVEYSRPRGYDVGYRAENNFTVLALPVPAELENADSYRVYFESTVGDYLQTETLTPVDGYVTVKITSDVVPEPGNMAAQLVAFSDGEIVGYAPMITGSAKVSIPDGTERLSHSLAAEIALNTAARHSHSNKAILDKFAETDGKPTYDGQALGGGSAGDITAEDVGYTPSEDIRNEFPELAELKSDTVKSGLDVAMYYAFAGMFTKNIVYDVQTASGTVRISLQNLFDSSIIPAMNLAHEHANKGTLDLLSVSNGKLQYNGSDVGLKGAPGITPTIGANGNWYLGTTDTGKPSRGEKGDKGDPGSDANVTKANVVAALGYTPEAVSAQVTTGSNITLADNTEYRLADVTTLTLTYPTGNFECWMRLTFAASGDATVILPTGTKYIGTTPDFKNGETWEMSIKDGVVIAQKVGDGT